MSRRELQVKVSPDLEQERQEIDVILGQKNIVRDEMLSLGETNKRLKSEIGGLEEQNTVLGNQKLHIERLVKDLVVLKSKHEQEIKDLDKVYFNKKSALEATLPNVKNILADLERQKQPIQSEVEKLSLAKDNLQKSLEKIDEQIKNKNKVFNDLETSVEHKTFQEAILKKSIGQKEIQINSLEEMVEKNKAVIEGIEKRQIVLARINYDITEAESKLIAARNEAKKSLENQNEELKKEIEKNKAINEQEKALHISLLDKQQVLAGKETFIRNQYVRAGLKYE